MESLRIFRIKWSVILGMVFLLPILGGCQDDGLPNEIRTINDAYVAIVGSWEWVETVSLNRIDKSIRKTSPATEDKSIQYVFQKDNKLTITDGGLTNNYLYSLELNSGGDGFNSTFWLISRNIENDSETKEPIQFGKDGMLVFYHMSVPISHSFRRVMLE
ncbi:MAG: hypothetical protein JJU34_09205 [Lunatimonas sp.]|uniref:hypothetical protein n=1 Tax=Lunatimonas sp. TaxID=2060141 RepID=UPI00263AC99B|nr:hypothetical protein [Lunatimonas sp.]MCC5937447.1 hypothetical protein [Lunatimonas sp.]